MRKESGIIDNLTRGKVGAYLQERIREGSDLSIVSAYFTIYAYYRLKECLDEIGGLRFLFGEPRFIQLVDPESMDARAFNIEDQGLALENRLEQKQVASDCYEWLRQESIQIRSIRESNLLHGKMYHIDNNGVEDAILGSSNFTVAGLGLGNAKNNIELNLVVDSRRDRTDLRNWFDEIWADEVFVEDVKDEVLRYVQRLYRDNAPRFIYFKTLFHVFEKFVADQEDIKIEEKTKLIIDTQIWNTLFDFQKDGVRGAINKILDYNGCIIADSVGLGKTYEALAIIKYFELQNLRVLVLCPNKLKENWTVYQASINSLLNPFPNDRFGYSVLAHTDLSRDRGYAGDINLETFNWSNFDLVVIDESHNFRNNNRGRKDEYGNVIRKSRYERLMEDILQSGPKTKVLLLSATPVNTDLKDLRNQIYLLTEGDDHRYRHSLGITSISSVLNAAQRTFNDWADQGRNRRTNTLIDRLSSAFFRLLDGLTIARSRVHLREYYPELLERLGGFPERAAPISIFPMIDENGHFPSYEELNERISRFRLSLYNPSLYLAPEYEHIYELDNVMNFTQRDRENYLIGMMKVNLLKRLESSVHSFTLSLGRMLEKIDDLRSRIDQFQEIKNQNPELDLDDLSPESFEDDELRDALEVGKKLVFNLAHLELEEWKGDLAEDYHRISSIYEDSRRVTPDRDSKLSELKRLIETKVKNPSINEIEDGDGSLSGRENKKVLVFTAFADTASYLFANLEEWAVTDLGIHVALVTGGTYDNATTLGSPRYEHILMNFAPVAKKRKKLSAADVPQDEEIDLLIATDCISEGQNLQDCDYVVNYDIHWNPVRLIQRFGRIDRINSYCKKIQMVNFWPTKDLERYISLKNRVEARMALVDLTATGYDDVLSNKGEVQELVREDLSFRDQQLLRLKDEVLDLEELTEAVALSEFSLNDFRIELSQYLEGNRAALEEAPFGLYAVVSTDPSFPNARPGVIFCLRQRQGGEDTEQVNPTRPYYLVYVLSDGREVRFNFTQPKQILDVLRGLCADKEEPLEVLCQRFDAQTDGGHDMRQYNQLLDKSVGSILGTFRRKVLEGLGKERDFEIPAVEDQISDKSDFDLITWVVILDE